ncbi:MAG: efflux RND transporter periplasmic adaptor subunit [Ferruginibacter sp.]
MKKDFLKRSMLLVMIVTAGFLQSCNNQQQQTVVKDSIVTSNIHLESLLKPVNGFAISSLPVTTLQQKNIRIPVKAFGTIEYDSRATGSISARVTGRIEKLYVRYRYEEVEKGQKIMDIYSPELLTAQQNLLFLLKTDAQNTSFVDAAKEKLLLLGMGEEQLKEVIKSRKPVYAVSIYSNYGGHIHEAGMDAPNIASSNAMQAVSAVTESLTLKRDVCAERRNFIYDNEPSPGMGCIANFFRRSIVD